MGGRGPSETLSNPPFDSRIPFFLECSPPQTTDERCLPPQQKAHEAMTPHFCNLDPCDHALSLFAEALSAACRGLLCIGTRLPPGYGGG